MHKQQKFVDKTLWIIAILNSFFLKKQLSRFQDKVPYNDVVWFVATQNKEFLKTLEKAYGKQKIITIESGPITTTFEPNEEGQKVLNIF